MNAVFVIFKETLILLRRDKIFVPAIIGGIVTTFLANLASDWSVEDFTKILFDVGAFGFQITGSLVAIFWGSTLISEAKRDGAIEVYLAAPVSRGAWLLGRFLGLFAALTVLALFFLAIWQVIMLLNKFGVMTPPQLTVFGFMLVGWMVIAALSMFFASFCSQGVALFASVSMWIAGLATNLVYQNLGPESGALPKSIVHAMARIWDLQQFNLIDQIEHPNIVAAGEIAGRLGYGLGLTSVLLIGATWMFSRRDIG